MERSKNIDPNAIGWKKLGGGSLHVNIGGKVQIIKPGQTFYALEDEIPLSFRDTIVPVDPVGKSKAVVKKEKDLEDKATASEYKLQHRNGKWWDVVNEDGKIQNEKALDKEAAEELLASLQ